MGPFFPGEWGGSPLILLSSMREKETSVQQVDGSSHHSKERLKRRDTECQTRVGWALNLSQVLRQL